MLTCLFIAHPRAIGESYGEHQRNALAFSGALFVAAGACFLHAFIPACCERTASRIIIDLSTRMRRAPSNSDTSASVQAQ